MGKRAWTEEEDAYIKDNFKVIPYIEIARHLNSTTATVQNRMVALGLNVEKKPKARWTEKEIETLKELAPKCYIGEIAKVLDRTEGAIITKACKLGLDYITTSRKYTEEELEFIRNNWGIIPVTDIARKLKVSRQMIRTQANLMNLPKLGNNPYNRTWTDEQIEKLKELAKKKTITELAKYFKTTNSAITTIAYHNGIKLIDGKVQWSEEDNNLLREYAKTMNVSEIAAIMNRNTSAVRLQAKRQGISIQKCNIIIETEKRNWTEEECEELKQLIMIDKKTPKEIGEILGRSEDAITVRASRLGIKIQTNSKRYWTKEEETLLTELWGTKSEEYIAKRLNRTVSSIKNKSFQLGLGSQMENNYDGLTIKEIAKLFNVSCETVRTNWVALGLKCKTRTISKTSSDRYVEIADLLDFLEKNQNIWDSRSLEPNILGEEPEWLKEKRKLDLNTPIGQLGLGDLTKQQLILQKKYFLENLEQSETEIESPKEDVKILSNNLQNQEGKKYE